MEPQEEKRRRRLLLVPGQCSEPEESYDERSKFSVGKIIERNLQTFFISLNNNTVFN